MSTHMERAVALAAKISTKAEDALAGLDREMTIMKWPGDYRAIMWEAVADLARIRAEAAKRA